MDVANGLEYMHGLRVVHGDLKGVRFHLWSNTHAHNLHDQRNILINDRFRACITDFGFSTGVGGEHCVVSNDSSASVSSEDSLMSFHRGGTLMFLSPELHSPKNIGADIGRQTKESDCYALGMVIYEVRFAGIIVTFIVV